MHSSGQWIGAGDPMPKRRDDRALLALVERCTAAKAARQAASNALEVAWALHTPGTAGAAARLRRLTSAFNAAADEHEGLLLVLSVAPTSTLEGVLAKFRALPADAEYGSGAHETTMERWKARDAAIVAAVRRGVACLGLGRR
jgi:hypothetical protein